MPRGRGGRGAALAALRPKNSFQNETSSTCQAPTTVIVRTISAVVAVFAATSTRSGFFYATVTPVART
jgi:hypothetical protein